MKYYFHPGYIRKEDGERVYVGVDELADMYATETPRIREWRVLLDSVREKDVPQGWHLYPSPRPNPRILDLTHVLGVYYFYQRRHAETVLRGFGYTKVNDEYFVKCLANEPVWIFARLTETLDGNFSVHGFSKLVLPD